VRSSSDGGLYADARLGPGGTGRRRGAALDGAESITVSPDGTSAYVASTSDSAVAVFDRAGDGTLTQKPGPAGCISDSGAGRCRDGTALDSRHSVAVSPDGQSVYVASASRDAVAVFDRAPNGRLAATNPRAVRGCRKAGGEESAAAAAAASVG
jgi:DNA-binding beta-propeller fold protein YncE